MRTKTADVKCNFRTRYENNLLCSLGCSDEDTQEHILKCKPLLDKLETKDENGSIQPEDIYAESKQHAAVSLYVKLFDIRNDLYTSNICHQ